MAMEPCLDCGELISDTAAECPKCGSKANISKSADKAMMYTVIVIVVLLILGSLFGS